MADLNDADATLALNAAKWMFDTANAICLLKEAKRRNAARALEKIAVEVGRLVGAEVGHNEFAAILDAVGSQINDPQGSAQ
jgi:hypothetical protein